MSTNLATILVGLGYDLSALEKGAPEAFRLINQQTLGMSAEMKRTSREGAESLRLIDEALGIHLSRPLTRLLTQEFPGFAKGLQAILGAGAFGAIAVAGVEFFDKIEKSIEKAQKAQEALKQATENVDKVFAEELGAYKDKDKAVTAATSAVDRLAEAETKQARAAQEAAGWFTGTLSDVGDFFHKVTSFQSTLDFEQINRHFSDFIKSYDTAAFTDSIDHTRKAVSMLSSEIKTASDEWKKFDDLANKGHSWYSPGEGVDRQAAALKDLVENLKRMQEVQDATFRGVANEEAKAALEKQTAAAKAFYQELSSASAKIIPDVDPIHKLSAEITAARLKAIVDFEEMRKAGTSALNMDHALAALDKLEKRFDQVFAAAKAEAAVAAAAKGLPSTITTTSRAPQFPVPTRLPELGVGGTTAAQFDVFKNDASAQVKLLAQAYQDVITPLDKFNLVQRELDYILKNADGSFKDAQNGAAAYAAALQNAQEEMSKSTDRLQKLLEKTDSVSAGMKAFFLQLNGETGKGGAGTFTFEILNKGLQGFEDETVKALTGAKTSWRQYFLELDQMALKFLLNKEIATLFKGFSGTSLGQSLGLDKLFGKTVADVATTANTAATVANTAAIGILTGAVSAMTASGFAQAAGSIGAVAGPEGAYASGTDFAPGGLSLVGENGPELVNLPTGASVTPNSTLRNLVPNVQIHIDAKGAEIGVEEKISRAISETAPQIIMRAVVEAQQVQQRSIQQRGF